MKQLHITTDRYLIESEVVAEIGKTNVRDAAVNQSIADHPGSLIIKTTLTQLSEPEGHWLVEVRHTYTDFTYATSFPVVPQESRRKKIRSTP